MGNTEQRQDGYYGEDGEFYPGNTKRYEDLYPKRPEINYTTTAYPGTNPPAQVKNDDVPEGYTGATKYCKFCGKKIPEQAVICTHCGCQVEEIKQQEQPTPVIINNNVNANAVNHNVNAGVKLRNKWVAFFLCFCFGVLGVHKFYEGKVGMGILYLLTGGLFGIGWLVDLIVLLCKPNPYNV